MGLKNIALRVDKLNGTILPDSTIGRGTTMSIEIPLNNNHETTN